MKTVARRVGQALAVIAFLIVFAAVMALVAVPLIMGWIPLTVLSGSMSPAIPAGSQVVVKPLDENQVRNLAAGDVITYMPRPDDPTLITHRIVDSAMTADGEIHYTVKGDANNAPDPEQVQPKQVRAIARYHVPLAGYVANVLSPQQKQVATYALVAALIAYALYQIIRSLTEKPKHKTQRTAPGKTAPESAPKAPNNYEPTLSNTPGKEGERDSEPAEADLRS